LADIFCLPLRSIIDLFKMNKWARDLTRSRVVAKRLVTEVARRSGWNSVPMEGAVTPHRPFAFTYDHFFSFSRPYPRDIAIVVIVAEAILQGGYFPRLANTLRHNRGRAIGRSINLFQEST
jgi:hypothetical protein